MTPQEQLLLQQQQKMAGYPTSDKPAIFPPDNGGQQAAAHPRANMFANWGQNGQGNWAKTANPTASQWVDQQKKSMNIGQNANPEPVVAPYAPGTKVVQQPAVQQKTAPAQNTGNTQVNQPITSADDLARAMGYTSPEEEDRLRKASVANQRIMAVADALRHIGNIANTVGYAPSQQFNSPVEMERQRYLQGKALRDKANLTYIKYQQAKAAQDAKQRQWEAEQKQKADQWNATFRYNAAKAAADLAEKQRQYDSTLGFNKEKQKATEARWDRLDKESERAHRASEALRRQSNGIAAGSLNLRRQEFDYKKKNGGGSGSGTQPTSLRGKNGWYSKRMNSEEAQAFYNQTYDEMKRRNLINEASVMAGLPADIFGQKSISLAAKKAAVDNALLQHPEVGDWLADEFEFDFDPRYEGSGTPFAPQPKQTFSPSYTPMLNGGRETIQGFGGGGFGGYSNSKERIPGFGG